MKEIDNTRSKLLGIRQKGASWTFYPRSGIPEFGRRSPQLHALRIQCRRRRHAVRSRRSFKWRAARTEPSTALSHGSLVFCRIKYIIILAFKSIPRMGSCLAFICATKYKLVCLIHREQPRISCCLSYALVVR